MANAPTLGELTSIRPEATVNPGVILDSRDAVHELNQSAQFNAEMKQKRYAQQLSALKDIYQDAGAIQAMPVMQQDRPILQKKMGDILTEIGNDPRAALGGPKFAEIQRGLGELRSLSTQSKQDLLYSDSHDKIMESDPSLATPGNKTKAANFDNQPLGQRQKFMLDMPANFDVQKFTNGLLKSPQIGTPYVNFGTEGDNNEFITKTTGTKYSRDKFLSSWNSGYDYETTSNGQPVKQWAQEQFNTIKNDPTALKRLGNPTTPEELWENMGKIQFGSSEDIIGDRQGTRTQNPYALEAMKERERLKNMSVKFGYDKALEGMKLGRSEELEVFKKSLRDKTQKEKTGALNGMVDNMVNNALLKKRDVAPSEKAFFGDDIYFKMDVSSPTLNAFAQLKNVDGKSVKVAPDEIRVSSDGQKVKAIFNQENGDPVVQNFSLNEFKARFGKDVLGVSATEKEINDAGEESSSSSTTTETTVKKPKLY